MRNLLIVFIAATCLWSCSSTEKDANNVLIGTWKGKWKMDPAAYPNIRGVDFEMDGKMEFTTDSATISIYGYPGCIFSVDTGVHTLTWKVSNDSLIQLFNEDPTPALTYGIKSLDQDEILLNFDKDISIALTRQ